MTHREAVAFAKELRRQKKEINQRETQGTRRSLYGLAVVAVILAGLVHMASLVYLHQTTAQYSQIATTQ